MMKRIATLLTGVFTGLLLNASAATLADSPADLTWTASGGASSSLSGDILTVTAAKNSQLTGALPAAVDLQSTGDFITVSFDMTVTGSMFIDDGSLIRIGFNNGTVPYAYYVAFEPLGGSLQAVFGETGDSNLGKFNSYAITGTTHSVSFTLQRTNTAAVLNLIATGDLINAAGQTQTVEPDIIPAATTNFNEVYFYFSGSQWTNAQTVTISNFSVEDASANTPPPPGTNAWVNSAADLTWVSSGGAGSSVTNHVLTITSAKNSQVLADLPSCVELATTNDYLMVSFDVCISGPAFADDGSTFKIGFNNSTLPYTYAVAFEPCGGSLQAIFSETGDTNLGKFDINAFGSSTHTVSFALKKTATAAGLDLTAVSDLITAAEYTQTVEPDIIPAATTDFNQIYFYFNGNQWTNHQVVTVENFMIEAVSTPVSTNTPPVPAPVSGNLLLNGDFEEGDMEWSKDGQHIIVSNIVHSGNAALQYVEIDTYAGLQTMDVTGGRSYLVSGWIKTDSGFTGTAGISLNFRDIDAVNLGNVLVANTRLAAGADWTELSQIVTVPTNAVLMKVMLVTGGTGLAWYDDLSVVKTNWPADTAIPAPSYPPIAGTWTTTFEDNFDGSTVDGTKWKLNGASGFAGTDSDQCTVSNGALTITAEPVPCVFKGAAYDWSTAALSTYKKFRQQYGYFETRLRWKHAVGMFPAFWTMPDRGQYGDTNENYKTYIKFDLSGISGPVTNAELQLHVSSVGNGTKSLNIFPVTDNWSEYLITWNNMPTENPLWLSYNYGFEAVAGTVLTYDLTDYINQQIAGNQTASIVLYDTFYMITQIVLDSREAAISANRPKLVINGATAVTASADAYVRSGSYADNNFGYSTNLISKESWKRDNQSTFITTNSDGIVENGMEMDIYEDYGHWGTYEFHHGIVWDGYDDARKSQSFWFSDPAFTIEEYHTYGMYWNEGVIEFYVDGAQTGVFETNRVCTVPSYLILSVQTFTNFWSGPINLSDYPADMDVDYVKVWSGTKQ